MEDDEELIRSGELVSEKDRTLASFTGGLEPIRITPVARVMSATGPSPRRSDRAYRELSG
jgi:hypothetical protein